MKTGTQLRDEILRQGRAIDAALQKLSAAIEELAAMPLHFSRPALETEVTQDYPACSTSLLKVKCLDGATRRLVEVELERGRLLQFECPKELSDFPLSEPTHSQALDLCGQFLRIGYQLAYREISRLPDGCEE